MEDVWLGQLVDIIGKENLQFLFVGVDFELPLFAKLKRHAICGHFHRTSEATEKVYDGDVVVTYSTGCLCELEPRYMEVNNHNHGFAIVDVIGENFAVSNKKIVNGKVY